MKLLTNLTIIVSVILMLTFTAFASPYGTYIAELDDDVIVITANGNIYYKLRQESWTSLERNYTAVSLSIDENGLLYVVGYNSSLTVNLPENAAGNIIEVFDSQMNFLYDNYTFYPIGELGYYCDKTGRNHGSGIFDGYPIINTDSQNNLILVNQSHPNLTYEKYDPDGTHLFTNQLINVSNMIHFNSAIDVNNHVHIVWTNLSEASYEYFLNYVEVDNNGLIINEVSILPENYAPDIEVRPVIFTYDNSVNIVYLSSDYDDGYSFIHSKILNNELVSQFRLNLNTPRIEPPVEFDIFHDEEKNHVHIVWNDIREGEISVNYAVYDMDGQVIDEMLNINQMENSAPNLFFIALGILMLVMIILLIHRWRRSNRTP